jgi:hypothetical protein
MFKFLTSLSLLIAFPAFAQMYVLGQGGYGQLKQTAAAANNVYPSGLTYGGGIGVRQKFFELEGLLAKTDLASEIDHDGSKNTLKHSQTTFNLSLNFYLNKRLYLRMGYAFNRIDQTLGKDVSAASEEGAKQTYGMNKNLIADGITYGGGVVIYDGSKVSLFTQLDSLNLPASKANVWNVSVGFRFYTR